jgi:hypothetical protein
MAHARQAAGVQVEAVEVRRWRLDLMEQRHLTRVF